MHQHINQKYPAQEYSRSNQAAERTPASLAPNRLVLTKELRYKSQLHKVTICSTTSSDALNKDPVIALQLNMMTAALPSEFSLQALQTRPISINFKPTL